MQWAEAGIQMISGVAGKICPPCNCGGREVFRKAEKKLVTAKSGLEGFDFRFASVAWVDECVFGL